MILKLLTIEMCVIYPFGHVFSSSVQELKEIEAMKKDKKENKEAEMQNRKRKNIVDQSMGRPIKSSRIYISFSLPFRLFLHQILFVLLSYTRHCIIGDLILYIMSIY